jgi:hypothetical protein
MIAKIWSYKIKYQPNTKTFVYDYDNLKEKKNQNKLWKSI